MTGIIDFSKSNTYYEIGAYFGRDFRGLDDSLKTTDKSEMQDFVHDMVSRGDYIVVTAHYGLDAVKEYRITPDYYWENFDGEFPYPQI